MPKKKPPDPGEKPQKQKFIDTARELGVDESGAEFERALGKIAPTKKPSRR